MSYESAVLADSPSLLWPLNETSGTTAADASGNGNIGTYTGGYTLNQGPGPSMGGGAVLLNGSSGYIQSSYNPALAAVSAECWVNLNGLSQGANPGFISNNPYAGSYGLNLYSNGPGDVFVTSYANGTSANYTYAGATPASGWFYVATTWDGTTFRLYFNGSQIAAGALSGAFVPNTNFVAGTEAWMPSGSFMNGLIAWVAIYPTALSATQVAKHYDAASSGLLMASFP